MKNFFSLILLTLMLLLVSSALANDGPLPYFHELLQEGQDVKIQIAMPESGEIDIRSTYRLKREVASSEEVLFTDRTFEAEDADTQFERCTSYDVDFCEENEEQCIDCDEDGFSECATECVTYYNFSLLDECVPPGETEYSLYHKPPPPPDESWDFVTDGTLTVVDTGDECLEGGDDDDDDDDSAGDDDDDDDDDSCGG